MHISGYTFQCMLHVFTTIIWEVSTNPYALFPFVRKLLEEVLGEKYAIYHLNPMNYSFQRQENSQPQQIGSLVIKLNIYFLQLSLVTLIHRCCLVHHYFTLQLNDRKTSFFIHLLVISGCFVCLQDSSIYHKLLTSVCACTHAPSFS